MQVNKLAVGQVQSHDAGLVYIYLLLKFQSRPDHWMAVSVNTYVSPLYQQLAKERQVANSPNVFAIDVCAYAIFSNHYHLVLHINEAEAKSWDTDAVIERWYGLFKRSNSKRGK